MDSTDRPSEEARKTQDAIAVGAVTGAYRAIMVPYFSGEEVDFYA